MNLTTRHLLWPGLPAVLGLAAAAGLLLMRAAYLEQADENRSLRRELQRLHHRDPYPSAEHVTAARAAVERMEYRVGELTALLQRDPFAAPASGPADFSARVQRAIERLLQRAASAGTAIPDSLEGGFSQYASGGAVPKKPFVPRLSRQLESVERVLDVLIRSGVTSIEKVGRDEFETAGSVRPERSARRRGRPDPRQNEVSPQLKASRVHPDGVYAAEEIEVMFTTDEAAFWRVLDGLADAPHFMTAIGLSHRVQTDILAYNPEAVKRGADSEDETLRYLSEGILAGEQALTRPERILVGNDPIRVSLTVEVYDFSSGEGTP